MKGFTTQEKTKTLDWLIISSAVLNIVFNYFETYGLNHYGPMGAVFNDVGATILSRILYLLGVMTMRKK